MSSNLIENLRKAVVDGNRTRVMELTTSALETDLPIISIIQDGLVSGLNVVGELFGRGEYYLPELLISGKVANEALEKLRPLVTEDASTVRIGKYLIGTVKGDIHTVEYASIEHSTAKNGNELNGFAV